MIQQLEIPQNYRPLEEIGQGGTSIVYRAIHKESGEEVAVKILQEPSEESRFQREATQLASLSHPNVVKFVESGNHAGHAFLVMEYLEAGDLEGQREQMSTTEILALFLQICDGLSYLHEAGIVHRDLKPANFLIDKNGQAKIADLGAARKLDDYNQLTRTGTILGTYNYLAPEQILSSSVGPSADIYSLGVCLFYSLTGRLPFVAANEFAVLRAHLEDTAPSVGEYLPEVPRRLEELVAQMLEKAPEERPESAQAVKDAILICLEEIQNVGQVDKEIDWDAQIEELPEELRSVLLAIGYLKENADFDSLCRAVPFSEDKTDRFVEELIQRGLVRCFDDVEFSLTFPNKFVESRLSSRVRKLLEKRLLASRPQFVIQGEPEHDDVFLSASRAAEWLESNSLGLAC